MSTYSAIIDSGAVSAQGFNSAISGLLVQGVASISTPSSLQVVQRGAGANMSVDISIGSCFVSYSSGTYGISAWTDSVTNLAITAADGTHDRIDAIVAWVDVSVISTNLSTPNNPGSLKFKDITGTPASSPVAPTDSAIQASLGAGVPWLRLSNTTVPQSATQIVTANIADVRPPFAVRARLWGGSSNTNGHTVPNVADDTVALLNATQSPTNKTISGTTNKVRSGGSNSSLADSNGIQVNYERDQADYQANYVVSGCVWTPESPTSTLNGSMTSGVVHIAGRRLTVAAVTAHAFTASKDTYVDFQDNGDGTATVSYTAVSNNATSPAFANSGTTANTLRDAKIVSGGSALAAASTSVVQYGVDAIATTGQVNFIYNTSPTAVPIFAFANTNTAGGSFYYRQQNGVKEFWGITANLTSSNGGTASTVNMPSSFFTLIQSLNVSVVGQSTFGNQTCSIDTYTTTSVSLKSNSPSGAASQIASVYVRGY